MGGGCARAPPVARRAGPSAFVPDFAACAAPRRASHTGSHELGSRPAAGCRANRSVVDLHLRRINGAVRLPHSCDPDEHAVPDSVAPDIVEPGALGRIHLRAFTNHER